MRYEDLIQKLENLETPEVELPGHRQALRFALLNSRRFQQRTIMDWARVVAPVAAAILLVAVVGFFNLIDVIQPEMQMARARDIALNHWQVQEWIARQGLQIREVKLQDSEALVFVAGAAAAVEWNLTRQALPAPPHAVVEAARPAGYVISLSGYVIRVNLVGKTLTAFAKVHNVTGLQDINLGEIEFRRFPPPGNEPSAEGDPGWPQCNLPR